IIRELMFHDPRHLSSLRALLFIPRDLVVHSIRAPEYASSRPTRGVSRDIPLITLPVPADAFADLTGLTDELLVAETRRQKRGLDRQGLRIVIPGAPMALVGGDPSVYMD